MATDPVRVYIAARTAVDERIKRVDALVQSLRRIAEFLKEWRQMPPILGASVAPHEMSYHQSDVRIQASDWPTADQVAQAIRAYHLAKREEGTAWEAVPISDRSGLQQPLV